MSDGNGAIRKAKFSLAMIVRNCAKELERCLKSFAAYPDEIVIVNTGIDENEPGFKETNAVAESFRAKVFHFPWIEDFSAARNFSFSKCSHDVVMWLDSDDTVEHPREFSECIRSVFGAGTVEVMYAEYDYDHDERGNCTALLTRERVMNRRFFEWRAPIHEVGCENFRARGAKLPANLGRIYHHHTRGEEQYRGNLERNLRILEHHYLPKEQGGLGEYCEERMLFYWGNTLVGLGKFEEALKKFLEYIPRSGSGAEIQQALCTSSECARLIGKLREARALAFQAIEKNPEAPTPYWMAAQAHYRSGNLQLAAHYALGCLERADQFQQEMVCNPKVVFGGSALLLATIKCNLGKLDEALPMLTIAAKHYGDDYVEIVDMRKKIGAEKEKIDLMRAYATLKASAEREGRKEDVRSLARAAPMQIRGFHDVARYLFKPRPNDKKTIAFLCGGGMPGGWGPELLKTGIGGSEEAVCYLAEQFVKKGWHVEVYAPCQRQTWQGVEWYPTEDFSGDDDTQPLDVLVVWRNAWQVIDFGAKAKRTYLWLHDMPDRSCWMADLWNTFDGIFVLSEFHKKVYDFIPDAKKIVSANGIPLERLPALDALTNEPTRMVYASCPTRGLETVLNWWDEIKKNVPTAELDVYYGFHPTLMAHANAPTPYGRQLKRVVDACEQMRGKPGVNWKGFVGHEELHAGLAKAGLWLYPTHFPEISCITAMKMQALGVVPVTVDNFALAETVKHGVKIPGNIGEPGTQFAWASEVVRLAKEPWSREQRLDMATAARSRCGWDQVADQWIGLFTASLADGRMGRVFQRHRLDVAATA